MKITTPPVTSFADQFLTAEETAVALKVRVETVRRWLHDGTLHGCKLGKVWRVPNSELQRLTQLPLPEETN